MILVLAGLAACVGGLDPVPLDVTLTSSRTTAVPGETISFVVNASGGSLLGVEIAYGDGAGMQYVAGGARRARVTFNHVYESAGVYQVTASAADATQGTKQVGLEFRVE